MKRVLIYTSRVDLYMWRKTDFNEKRHRALREGVCVCGHVYISGGLLPCITCMSIFVRVCVVLHYAWLRMSSYYSSASLIHET